MEQEWESSDSIEELRAKALAAATQIGLLDDPRSPATDLWRLGMTYATDSLAGGLWQIWGRITDEWTHPQGDESAAIALARESAGELTAALGDAGKERSYCDRWIYERLDIVVQDSP